MNEDDFKTCEFIDKYLRFVTYNDFCENCKAIKAYFKELAERSMRFYKWYVYSNVFIDEQKKNIIWQYLTNDDPEYYIRLVQRYHKDR